MRRQPDPSAGARSSSGSLHPGGGQSEPDERSSNRSSTIGEPGSVTSVSRRCAKQHARPPRRTRSESGATTLRQPTTETGTRTKVVSERRTQHPASAKDAVCGSSLLWGDHDQVSGDLKVQCASLGRRGDDAPPVVVKLRAPHRVWRHATVAAIRRLANTSGESGLALHSCRRTLSAAAETRLQRRHVCDVPAGACVHPVRLD